MLSLDKRVDAAKGPSEIGLGNVTDGPLKVYARKTAVGELNKDDHQQKVVERLQLLHETLKTYQPTVKESGTSWFKKVIIFISQGSRS